MLKIDCRNRIWYDFADKGPAKMVIKRTSEEGFLLVKYIGNIREMKSAESFYDGNGLGISIRGLPKQVEDDMLAKFNFVSRITDVEEYDLKENQSLEQLN